MPDSFFASGPGVSRAWGRRPAAGGAEPGFEPRLFWIMSPVPYRVRRLRIAAGCPAVVLL
jgi:hypothetical protein